MLLNMKIFFDLFNLLVQFTDPAIFYKIPISPFQIKKSAYNILILLMKYSPFPVM